MSTITIHMCSKEAGIFGAFSYREFKYNGIYFGFESNTNITNDKSKLTSMLERSQRLFRCLADVELQDFTEQYENFQTFLTANKFKQSDFVSYILPKEIKRCYERCFLRSRIRNKNGTDLEVILKHLTTLSIIRIDHENDNFKLTLKSKVCDDEITLYARTESNQIETIDELLTFYNLPSHIQLESSRLEQNTIKDMVDNNQINVTYLYDTTKLFPRENDNQIISAIKELILKNNSSVDLFMENLSYKIKFGQYVSIDKSKSFYITSFLESWSVAYERKVKRYIVLNVNKIDGCTAVENDMHITLLTQDKIIDGSFNNKINICKQRIPDIIFLLQHDF